MATKKKTKKKQQKRAKKTAAKKTASKKAAPKKVTRKLPKNKKRTAKRTVQSKTARGKVVGKKAAVRKKLAPARKQVRGESLETEPLAYLVEEPTSQPGGQSGDLQGLSGVEGADSESVQELLEEGNAFEADVVTGVERAGETSTKEVRTHEVPEDDVPEEYLDNER
jgi:hypothetical protein